MDSPHYTSRLSFWIATIFVIIVTVFAVILREAGPGNGGLVSDLWLTIGLAILPGSCVGFLQAYLLAFPSRYARVQWFGITVTSTALGWCIVFALMALLDRLQLLPTITNELIPSIIDGLLTGGLIGIIIGLTVGAIQRHFQHIASRQWIVDSLISWSIGIAIPITLFFAFLSQISFLFMM